MGKGDRYRKVNQDKFNQNFDRIFNKRGNKMDDEIRQLKLDRANAHSFISNMGVKIAFLLDDPAENSKEVLEDLQNQITEFQNEVIK